MTKNIIINVVCLIVAVLLLIGCAVLGYNLWREKDRHEADLETSHGIFTSVFADFSAELWEEKDEFDVKEQQLRLQICFTAKNASQFASDNEVSDLLLTLQNLSLEGNLKDLIDKETIDDINRLSTLLTSADRLEENRELLQSINDRLNEILTKTK